MLLASAVRGARQEGSRDFPPWGPSLTIPRREPIPGAYDVWCPFSTQEHSCNSLGWNGGVVTLKRKSLSLSALLFQRGGLVARFQFQILCCAGGQRSAMEDRCDFSTFAIRMSA